MSDFNLSSKRTATSYGPLTREGFLSVKDVKEFIRLEEDLANKFINNLLNSNVISKNFIEIRDFHFHFNKFLEERKKIAGEELI